MIDTIMLFAAGLGNRMRHLTENSPKSLIKILDKPILYYVLDLCKTYPFKKIIINTHYKAEQLNDVINEYKNTNENLPEIKIIYEEELLETGGAIKNALAELGENPIFTMNTDVIINSKENVFNFLASKWDPDSMNFILLMQKFERAIGYKGLGDFDLTIKGKLVRQDKMDNYNYIYSGLQILKPTIIAKHPLKIFSLKEYYLNSDKVSAIEAPENMRWYHASSPEDLVEIEMDLLSHNM